MEEYNDKDKYNNENINKKYNRFNDPTAAGFWTGSIVNNRPCPESGIYNIIKFFTIFRNIFIFLYVFFIIFFHYFFISSSNMSLYIMCSTKFIIAYT